MEDKTQTMHHALRIRQEICIGCSRCMRFCPTEALRVVAGKAVIYPDWCVDCGECYRVCPSHAVVVEDDDIAQIFQYRHRILLIPAVFFGQFEEKLTLEEINGILYEMGFTELCTVEQGVDTLIDSINSYINQEDHEKPIISSFCPAVIRMIQVRFPALADNIMRLIPPLEITAQYYRDQYEKQGVPVEDVGIFYVTPCAAKISAIKAPIGGYVSPINGVINMNHLYNSVFLAFKQKRNTDSPIPIHSMLSSKGILWATTGGEAKNIQGRSLAIDAMENVIDFLERLENDEIKDLDYLELRACDESCAGGILAFANRFLVKERLASMATDLPQDHEMHQSFNDVCNPHLSMDRIEEKTMVKFGTNIKEALIKMEETRRLHRLLPNIDCGACGAPSCEALAEDVVCRGASIEQCVFMMSDTPEGKQEQTEQVWGKARFRNLPKIKK